VRIKEIVDKFGEVKVLVIGDVMLDEFVYGDTKRISPEAPIPVVHVKRMDYTLGGAGNTANNVASLGGKCALLGVVGDDSDGLKVKDICKEKGISDLLVIDSSRPTIKKSRVVSRVQHVVRVDREESHKVSEDIESVLMGRIKDFDADVVIVSDYNKGLITPGLMEEIKKLGKKVIADFKPVNRELFKDVLVITPNLKEAQELGSLKVSGEDELNVLGNKLKDEFRSNVLITRGPDGVSLFGNSVVHIPSKAREVYDVSGAGDTVVSALALSIGAGASLEGACIVANTAGSLVVEKLGTATITRGELLGGTGHSKIKTREQITEIVRDLRNKGSKVVFTSGYFDILHIGHARYLQESKAKGEILVVGLNTDDSIRRKHGPSRPIVNEKERAEMLASLKAIDYIVFFNEDTPLEILKSIQPEVYTKGSNWKKEDLPETPFIESYGGEVVLIDLVSDRSTADIINKIKRM
jgi:D-beta-D-heptose 7-phosphate kinase/D-beta-D-heptose 1-phosphate adenosyltransferase